MTGHSHPTTVEQMQDAALAHSAEVQEIVDRTYPTDDLDVMVARAISQGRLTRVPMRKRGYTEREMYLRTEASDVEREEDRIQRLLAQPARKQ